MDNALTPREIQARIRSGSSVADLAADSGMDEARIEPFAAPVLAEREHMAAAALTATARRRGEAGSHRRLGELIGQRLAARGIDEDAVAWDAWRQNDLKWRVVGTLDTEAGLREAEFVFDPKARFSVASNADARWMIGEDAPGARPEDENTVDLNDELALVRAVSEVTVEIELPGDDVPASELMQEGNEDTSRLDRLYDMLSGISEDSVRIYAGVLDEPGDPDAESDPGTESEPEPSGVEPQQPEPAPAEPESARPEPEPAPDDAPAPTPAGEPVGEATQEPLVEGAEEPKKQPRGRKQRASIPSWDEIMFGGPKR